jgi:hypothetical protein
VQHLVDRSRQPYVQVKNNLILSEHYIIHDAKRVAFFVTKKDGLKLHLASGLEKSGHGGRTANSTAAAKGGKCA